MRGPARREREREREQLQTLTFPVLVIGILSGTIDCKSMHLPDESAEIHLGCCFWPPASGASVPMEFRCSGPTCAAIEEAAHSYFVVQLRFQPIQMGGTRWAVFRLVSGALSRFRERGLAARVAHLVSGRLLIEKCASRRWRAPSAAEYHDDTRVRGAAGVRSICAPRAFD